MTDRSLDRLLPWLAKKTLHDLWAENTNISHPQARFMQIKPWLDLLPSDFNSVLDTGCGFGYSSAYFYSKGHDVLASDMRDYFLFRDEIEFANQKLEDLPSERKFDAIFMCHVLEHIFNLDSFMQAAKEKLNDRGYLFVVVPHSKYAEQSHLFASWSIPQLAALLVSFGFDCSTSIFQMFGYNLCGYGVKTETPFDYDHMFNKRMHFFPSCFSEILRPNCDFYQNVEYAHKDEIIRSSDVFGLPSVEMIPTGEKISVDGRIFAVDRFGHDLFLSEKVVLANFWSTRNMSVANVAKFGELGIFSKFVILFLLDRQELKERVKSKLANRKALLAMLRLAYKLAKRARSISKTVSFSKEL